MKKTSVKRNNLLKKFVEEVLYMDMEERGTDVGFLKETYYKLRLQDKERITDMRYKLKRKSVCPGDVVREEIIAIIIEEIFQNKNKELYMDLIEYYSKEFPEVIEVFKICGNDVMRWCYIYFNFNRPEFGEKDLDMIPNPIYYAHSEDYDFMPNAYSLLVRTFFCLYCLTYGEENLVDDFIKIWEKVIVVYHMAEINRNFTWYDREDAVSCLEKIWEIEDLRNDNMYKEFMEKQRRAFADYYQIEADSIDEFIIKDIVSDDSILIRHLDNEDEGFERLYYHSIGDELNAISRENHVNPYVPICSEINTVQDCFERYWIMVVYNAMLKLRTDNGLPSMEEMFDEEYSDMAGVCQVKCVN